MATGDRVVYVSFLSLQNTDRKKKIRLKKSEQCDLQQLKEELIHEMKCDESYKDLGSVDLPSLDDILIFQFDEEIKEEVELSSREILNHLEKNLIVKLKNTTVFDIPAAGSNDPLSTSMVNGHMASFSRQECPPLNQPKKKQKYVYKPDTGPILDDSQDMGLLSTDSDDSDSSRSVYSDVLSAFVTPPKKRISEHASPQPSASAGAQSNSRWMNIHTTEKVSDYTQDMDFRDNSGSTKSDSEKEGNVDQQPNEKGSSSSCDITLPIPGDDEWDLNQILVDAINNEQLLKHLDQYAYVCARHIIRTGLTRSRTMYAKFTDMVIDEYPYLSGSFATLKSKIVRSIGNYVSYARNKPNLKLKRLEQKLASKNRKDIEDDNVSVNAVDEELETNTINLQVDQEEVRLFVSRRAIVDKGGKKYTTAKLLEDIPLYKDFRVVMSDFLRLIDKVTEEDFKRNYAITIANFGNYLDHLQPSQKTPNSVRTESELLNAINKLSSTDRSSRKAATPLVLTHLKIGEKPNMDVVGQNPHAFLFWGEEPNMVPQLMLIVGGVLNYPNIPVSSISEALFKLLAVYYIIHLNYPAAYGLLELMDRFCLKKQTPQLSLPTSNKKAKGTKQFLCISTFIEAYDAFLESEQ